MLGVCSLGIVVRSVFYIFLETYVQATARLPYVRQVACVACQLINTPFIVGRNVVVFFKFVQVGVVSRALESTDGQCPRAQN